MARPQNPERDRTPLPKGPDYDTYYDPRKQFKVHPDILGSPAPMPRTVKPQRDSTTSGNSGGGTPETPACG